MAKKKNINPVFRRYTSLRQATLNPNSPDYPRIGAKGITLYWDNSHDFCNYVLKNLGLPPQGSKSRLTRINLKGNYEPGNLKWGTPVSVAYQRNLFFTYKKTRRSLKEWAELLNVSHWTLYWRYRQGWSVKKIIETPIRKQNKQYA